MKRDGKRALWKSHPEDHRVAAIKSGAEAWGGSVSGGGD